MNRLIVQKTPSTPFIDFDSEAGLMKISGESFPENAARFYAPVLTWIDDFFAMDDIPPMTLECNILYFNSSTSKILMNLFDDLETHVLRGRTVSVRWLCHPENEMAIECGEEFREDLETLPFEIVTEGK